MRYMTAGRMYDKAACVCHVHVDGALRQTVWGSDNQAVFSYVAVGYILKV